MTPKQFDVLRKTTYGVLAVTLGVSVLWLSTGGTIFSSNVMSNAKGDIAAALQENEVHAAADDQTDGGTFGGDQFGTGGVTSLSVTRNPDYVIELQRMGPEAWLEYAKSHPEIPAIAVQKVQDAVDALKTHGDTPLRYQQIQALILPELITIVSSASNSTVDIQKIDTKEMVNTAAKNFEGDQSGGGLVSASTRSTISNEMSTYRQTMTTTSNVVVPTTTQATLTSPTPTVVPTTGPSEIIFFLLSALGAVGCFFWYKKADQK